MIDRISNSIRIEGPAEAVFDLVTTARFWPQWHPATRDVGGVTERPYLLGDTVHERGNIGGAAFSVAWKVIEHIRPRRIALHCIAPIATIIYTFEADGRAVQFTRELEYDSAVFAEVAPDGAAVRALMNRQSELALQRLRELVERILQREQGAPES